MGRFVSEQNQRRWASKEAASIYRDKTGLFPVEKVVIDGWRGDLAGWRVLDLGIGAGRTTAEIAPLCGTYVGIDYSPEMIREARRRCPDATLACADARQMPEFETESFDLAIFSFNGLDYTTHEDRLQILAEIRRVLKRGGLFFFSAHNRDFHRLASLSEPAPLRLSWHPVRLLRAVFDHLAGKRNSAALSAHRTETDEYAIIVGSEFQNGVLTYWISGDRQREQLQRAGFQDVEAFDGGGRKIAPGQKHPDDFMIHYLARRA